MVELTAGDERYRDDRGAADPAVEGTLAAYADGMAGEHAVLVALAAARLLVPVMALPGDGAGPLDSQKGALDGEKGAFDGRKGALDGEKNSEMALPAIVGTDGRRALPAFTSLDTVRRWKASARPVPVQADAVWQSAVAEGSVVVIDIAGPVPLLVEGARLAALATGTVLGMHEDPDAWQQVAAAAAQVAPGIRVKLSPPNGGIDFTLELAPPEGTAGPVPSEVADRVGDAVLAALRDRVRAGIAVVVRPAVLRS
jgi:hypothetical protein